MAMLDVIKYGHPTLRKVAEPYIQEEIDQEFIEDMLDTMYEEDGVGLAAPQVNVSKRMIVVSDREIEYVLFNPKIIANSESSKYDYEGCLSLPGLHANVPRYEKIVLHARDAEWNPVEITARGLSAVVFQHEIDHLNGVFYIDRADLSTLKWTDAEIVEDALKENAASIPEIQTIFKDKYLRDVDQVQFEKMT